MDWICTSSAMRNDRVMPVLGGVGTHFLLARLCGYIGLITSNYRDGDGDGDGDGDEIRLDLLQLSDKAEKGIYIPSI